MKDFIGFIVKQFVENPDKLSVKETTSNDHMIEFNLKVVES
jgi:predicted RNA-binding protein YlqC (UPF0109 family)